MMRLVASLLALLAFADVACATDSEACLQARQEALEPIGKIADATMRLVRATAAECGEMKLAWEQYQSVSAAAEVAFKRVTIACGPAAAPKTADLNGFEDLVRSCDGRK
jgi:hypothetical protein